MWIVLLVAAAASRGAAQEHPREHARLGQVHFDTSCVEATHEDFDAAVALLHSFQFSDAIERFETVLREDPGCAIAYWGIALSDWSNPFAPGLKDVRQLRAGHDSAERGKASMPRTDRERAYLEAVGRLYDDYPTRPQDARLSAYRDAMAGVAAKYPDDHEARIFYALALAAADDPNDRTYANRLAAGAILERLFAEEPLHPGLAHYIIHAYDVPALAGQASAAAERYARIAPDAPHALHMPSHTFTRLGRWQESIASNAAAAASAKRQGQTAEELHASDYEAYAFLQTGQDRAAARVVDSVADMASRFDPSALLIGAGPPSAGYYALAAIPARFALERRDWRQAEGLTAVDNPFAFTQAVTWFARGLGAARQGHVAPADEAAKALQTLSERLVRADEPYWARQVEIQALVVAAWSAWAGGDVARGLRQMKAVAVLEDRTDKSVLTPGPLAPARELLGEMLLQAHRPDEAFRQFEATLDREPRRFWALYGAARAAQLAGHRRVSRRYFAALLEVCAPADEPGRPELRAARRALTKRPRTL